MGGSLGTSSVGTRVALAGWVDGRRDHGGLVFIDLRDESGVVQLVVNPERAANAVSVAHALRNEFVIRAEGEVVARAPDLVNPNLATGEIEVQLDELEILSSSVPLPFQLQDENVDDNVRMRYRWLDLRRPKLQRNIRLRGQMVGAIRRIMESAGFVDIQTPILWKPTPEGARDFLVPSRLQPGRFYALPQSPQIAKQLLVISGFERYYQIAICFRDEDLRADRVQEITQLDVEMAFPDREFLLELMETMIKTVWQECIGVELETPFPRMTYAEADRRFDAPEWEQHPFFRLLKQSYLALSKQLLEEAERQGVDPDERQRLVFHLRQFIDAISPTTFLPTNPAALRKAWETGGGSVADGLRNLLDDLHQGRLSMTDTAAFAPGKNLATTPGKVVYRNRLIELIHYAPMTAQTYAVPLLFIPPWINKFYVLDLQPKNSLVRFLLEQGFSVFMISWKNPDASMEAITFEDYMTDGPLAASDVVREITGAERINPVGYCIGGTLLAMTLAYLAARRDERFGAATFMVSLLDFSEVGDTAVFIDEPQIAYMEQQMLERGLPKNTRGRCANPRRQVVGDHEDHHSAIFNFARLRVVMRGAIPFRKVGKKYRLPWHAEIPRRAFNFLLGGKHCIAHFAAGVLARECDFGDSNYSGLLRRGF